MNYYNPYIYNMPVNTISSIPRSGIFNRLLNGINFSSILNGTQRTLNIVNQSIPLIKQAKPIFKNAKTMFKVMNEFKKVDTNNVSTNSFKEKQTTNYNKNNDGPIFFI